MFEVIFEDSFLKKLRKMDRQISEQIIHYFDNEAILKDPKHFAEPLVSNKKGNWRFRIGDYRVICKIIDKELVILALDVGHRSKIYK